MNVQQTELPGLVLIEPKVFGDARGYFLETWAAERYAKRVVDVGFVQDNLSRSRSGILRGLHLQHPHGQGKLVYVVVGEVFDVAVDVRRGSTTFGRFFSTRLSEHNKRQLFIPPGFAHGFCVTSDEAVFVYKCTDAYHPEAEVTIAYDDPDIGIPWPIAAPTISDKDRAGLRLCDVPQERLPRFEPKAPSPSEGP